MRDWLWNSLMWLLPDLTPKESWEAFRDSLSLLIGGLGVIFTWRAIRMGREQKRLAEEQRDLAKDQKSLAEQQTAAAERQERLDLELAAITKEQHAIAKLQSEVMQRELARRPLLSMDLSLQSVNQGGGHSYILEVRNDGSIGTESFYWWLYIPLDQADTFGVVPTWSGGKEPAPNIGTTEEYKVISSHWLDPIYPEMGAGIARCGTTLCMNSLPFTIRWKVVDRFGKYPSERGATGELLVSYRHRRPQS